MEHRKRIIGIDPDTEKSGVALLNTETGEFEKLESMSFFELFEFMAGVRVKYGSNGIMVIIEGGWLVEKSNFHIRSTYNNKGERIAKNVGANHETGKKIVEMCQYTGITYRVIKPLKKFWSGQNRKITHKEFEAITDQKLPTTNQETRDAALIAWTVAGLPFSAHRPSSRGARHQ